MGSRKLQDALEALMDSNSIKENLAKEVREWHDKYQRDLSELKHYTGPGKEEKRKAIKNWYAFILLEKLSKLQNQYEGNLEEAQQKAEEFIKESVNVPPEEEQEAFKQKLEELETELYLINRPEKQQQKLKEFLEKEITQPYFAELTRQKFGSIAKNIIENTSSEQEAQQAKKTLADSFESLRRDYLPEEVRQAYDAKEKAEANLQNPKLVPGNHNSVLRERFREVGGLELEGYLDNPKQLYEDFPELPANVESEYERMRELERKERIRQEERRQEAARSSQKDAVKDKISTISSSPRSI